MLNLIYKEFRLAAHPNLFVFTALGVLVIVPAYPYGMVFLFGCLAPYMTFMYGRETNDIYYTALLPVRKGDIVRAKVWLVALVQMAQLMISLPCAFLRVPLLPGGNPAGIEANVAYYGFGLLVYGVFDFIFLTQFFKTGYKAGRAFLLAIIPAFLLVVLMEALVHFPMFGWLDSIAPAMLLRQVPLLILGSLAYVGLMALATRLCIRRFERVDL